MTDAPMKGPVLDMLGRPLREGSSVAFAALSYRSAHLRTGEVVEINPDRRDSVRVMNHYAQRREWHRGENLVRTA